MKQLECSVVRTRSGDRAIRDAVSGEVMHPMGPASEARSVYVGPSRLEARLLEGGAPLILFDVGLGAATNAIAAWNISESLPGTARRLEIVSFETDLSALQLVMEPEFRADFGFERNRAVFEAATAILRDGRYETPRTTWRLLLGDFRSMIETAAPADIIFWDMFSPGVDSELWSVATFSKLRARCRDGATVHTYSAATSTRSALLLAGFFVGIGDAIGARAQTTVAATRRGDLASPLDGRWLERLARSSAPFPPDVTNGTEALRRVRELAQFVDAKRL